MRSITPKELSITTFVHYGHFAKLMHPDGPSVGPAIHEFFRDQLVFSYASAFPVGISVSHVQSRPMVIDTTEIHRNSGEVLFPLNGDIYCHVGMPSGHDDPNYDAFEVFRVPAGTAIMLNNGVWHFAAFPCGSDDVDVMVLLPERTYANDCIVKHIPAEHQMKIDA